MRVRIQPSAIIAAILFTAIYWRHALIAGVHDYLRTDEVFTLWMVRDVPSVVSALAAGADTAPPGFYYMIAASCKLFGFTPIGLRITSILFLYIFVATLFFLLRRFVSDTIALAAAILPLLASATGAEINARPYAGVMACFALICLVWSGDSTERPSWLRCFSLSLLLAIAMSLHFYGVLLVPLLGIMELIWEWRQRVIRWRIWTGIAVGAATLLLWLPVIVPIFKATHSSAQSPGYYAIPSVNYLLIAISSIAVSHDTILAACFFIFVAAGYRLLARATNDPSTSEVPALDAAASDSLSITGFAAFLVPFVTYAFALVVTRVFNERYIWTFAAFLSFGFVIVYRRFPWPKHFGIACVVVVLGLYGARTRKELRTVVAANHPDAVLMQEAPGNEPVVTPDGGTFFAMQESVDPRVRSRNVYLLLPEGMLDPDTEPARIARVWKKLKPGLPIYTNEEFLATHPKFYIGTAGTSGQGLTAWATRTQNTRTIMLPSGRYLMEVTH